MMVYGICAGPSGKSERIAIPGIRAADPDARILTVHGQRSIFTAYNRLLDEARALPGVDSIMLIHDDTELQPGDWLEPLAHLVADPTIGLIGVVGGTGHPRMFWWEGTPEGHLRDNQRGLIEHSAGTHDVDTVDGLLLLLTGEAFKRLRFDQATYGNSFHGYDADISAQVRALGLRVVVTDIPVTHRNNVERPLGDVNMLYICDARYMLKWTTQTPAARYALRTQIARLSFRRIRKRLRSRLVPAR
jgi:hypothetical protein